MVVTAFLPIVFGLFAGVQALACQFAAERLCCSKMRLFIVVVRSAKGTWTVAFSERKAFLNFSHDA